MSTKDAWKLFETKQSRKRRKKLHMYGLDDDDDVMPGKRSRGAKLGSAVSSSASAAARYIGSAGASALSVPGYAARFVGKSAAAISVSGAPKAIAKYAKKSGKALYSAIAKSGPAISAAAAYLKSPTAVIKDFKHTAESKLLETQIAHENHTVSATQMYYAVIPALLTTFAAASSYGHILDHEYKNNEYDDAEDEEKNNGLQILGMD